jgi:hypothetical protein
MTPMSETAEMSGSQISLFMALTLWLDGGVGIVDD